MAWPEIVYWLPVFGGYSEQQIESLRQDQRLVELSQSQEVISDPLGAIVTRPGFSAVRAAAISGTPSITGMQHMQDLADLFLLGASDGKLYQDSASPPAEVTGGTAFTTGATVLRRFTVFNNKVLMVSTSRDKPQTIETTPTKADLGGTPARGVDVKAFARRVCMFSPSDGSTTYRGIMSFTSANDDETAWVSPYLVNALTFGKTGSDANVLGGEIYKDHLMTFTEDRVYPVYATPNALLPMAFQDSLFSEDGGGPPNIHGVVAANDCLYWISRTRDVKRLRSLSYDPNMSIGYAVQPFLRGLTDAQLTNIVGGWEPKYRMVVWAMADAGSSTHNIVLAMHVDPIGGSHAFHLHTLSRTAFANRQVGGQPRLIGGGLAGFFYNEYDSSTIGNADSASTAIDADLMGPRHHLGLPGVTKKGVVFAVDFDPMGTETVTVQFQYDDSTTWETPAEGAVVLSGTDYLTAYFNLPPFVRHRPRFRDAISGERFRILRYGYSRPTSVYTVRA